MFSNINRVDIKMYEQPKHTVISKTDLNSALYASACVFWYTQCTKGYKHCTFMY